MNAEAAKDTGVILYNACPIELFPIAAAMAVKSE